MEHHENPVFYKDLLLLLGTAGVVIPLFHRLRITPVIGYLIAGILIGPYGIGRLAGDSSWPAGFSISDTSSIAFVGELGVVMLLFMIGLELSPARLYTLRRLVFLLGSAQLVLSAGLLGFAAYLLGMEPKHATVLGLALALSSTAIVVELLSAEKRLGTQVGRTTFSILLLQDLAFVAILLFIGSLGRTGGAENIFVGILLALLQAVVAIAAIMVLGRFALRPFLRLVAEAGGTDLFLASIMFIVTATAILSQAAGLTMGFGAFVAGLLIAETEFRREAESLIDPFKGLLLGIFFISVTMTINPAILIEQPVLVLGSVLGLIAVKAAVVAGVAPLFGLRWPTVVETALLTGPGGEFGFVALGAAAAVGALPGEVARNGTLIIAVSMFALPFISAGAGRLNRRMEAARPLPPEAEIEPPAHDGERVLIVGFGRVGQLVADMLEEYDVPYIAVDSDANLVARRRADGKPVFYGNAERPEFLRRCGIANAKALVVTMDAPAKVDSLTQIARAERDDLIIVARARDEQHARQLYRLGVTDAVPETTEASLQLGEAVLDEIGIPIGIIIAGIHQRREDSRRALGRKDRRRKAAAKAAAETKIADKAGSQ
jgi:CPA2 family monovalent cation:H+ antiporter-2